MKIAFTFLLCIQFLPVFAQDSVNTLSPHMIGGSVSMMTGYGLTYGYYFTEVNLLKAKLFGYIETDGSRNEESQFEFGLEYQQTFMQSGESRLYILTGGYYEIQYDEYEMSPTTPTIVYKGTVYTLGVGVGLEQAFWKHILIHLDGGVVYRTYERTATSDFYNNGYPRRYLGVAAGLGVMYRF